MKYAANYFFRILFIAALLLEHAAAQERHLRTYTLRHALPEQVVPALSAQLAPGSSVTPYRQQLILNVTDAEYQTLQALLDQLDTAPRSLLISVRKQSQQSNDNQRYGIDGRIGDGAVQVQTNNGWQQRNETRVDVIHDSAQKIRDGSQQVRTVEGMQAYINTGHSIAVRNNDYGQREFVPVESGFYATARIVGDEVIVDIEQRDDRPQGHGIATQNLQTQIRGAIGEWISLGGLSTSQASGEHTVTSDGNSASNSTFDLAIKVELIDR